MVILLPFYLLKLRKKTVAAKTSKMRKALADEIKQLIEVLVETVSRAEQSGSITHSVNACV
jgi:hypothetical protein